MTVNGSGPAAVATAVKALNVDQLGGLITSGDNIAATHAQVAVRTQRAADDWRRIIADDLGRAAEGIISAGRHLQEAKDEVEHGDWLPLVKSLRLSERTAQRLMKIAANEVLANPTHGSHLPPSWRTLYELSTLPPRLLEARIIDGTITPEIERKDIALLKGKGPANVSRLAADEPDPPAPKTPNATLVKEVEASRAHAEELETALEAEAEELHRLRRENIALQSEVEDLRDERDRLRARIAELENVLATFGARQAGKPKRGRGRPKGSKNKPKVQPINGGVS